MDLDTNIAIYIGAAIGIALVSMRAMTVKKASMASSAGQDTVSGGAQKSPSIVKKFFMFIGLIVVVLTVFCAQQWYSYVTNTSELYDEIGIDLNSRMPLPIRKWGCDQLQANFKRALPPHGCSNPNGTGKEWL